VLLRRGGEHPPQRFCAPADRLFGCKLLIWSRLHGENNKVWVYLDKEGSEIFSQVIKEITMARSERAAAIVAGTLVEDHLTTVLKRHLIDNPKKVRELFDVTGPLGAFGTKIDLGYLLGLYSEAAWKELDTIKRIRNEFAHKMEANSFQRQKISGLSDNLKLWEQKRIKLKVKGIKVGDIVELSFNDADEIDPENEVVLIQIPSRELPFHPYFKFVSACQFYVAAFAILGNVQGAQKGTTQPPLF